MTEREVESRSLGWVQRNGYLDVGRWEIWMEDDGSVTLWLDMIIVATLPSPDEAKSLAQRLQDVLDGVPDQARAEGRAEALAEVVAKLEIEKRRVQALIIERDEPSGYLSLLRGEESGLLGAIATVREMGQS